MNPELISAFCWFIFVFNLEECYNCILKCSKDGIFRTLFLVVLFLIVLSNYNWHGFIKSFFRDKFEDAWYKIQP